MGYRVDTVPIAAWFAYRIMPATKYIHVVFICLELRIDKDNIVDQTLINITVFNVSL